MGFPTTRWSLIVASGDRDVARMAWNELAGRYRAPIRAWFACRYGTDRADDLTHAFFVQSIDNNWWARADIERGSFRTYLRMMLHRFGARHGEHSAPLDGSDAAVENVRDGDDPEQAYERAFAQTLVRHAMDRLREQSRGDRLALALLDHVLERGEQGDLKQVANALGLMQNTVSQRLRRMRLQLRESLREEIALLVVDPDRVDDELQGMRETLAGG